MRNAFELRWLYRQGHRNQTQTNFSNLPIVLRLSKSNADISLIRSCIWFLSFLFLSIDLSDILAVRALFDLNVYRTETCFVSVHHQIRFFPTSIYVKLTRRESVQFLEAEQNPIMWFAVQLVAVMTVHCG